MAYLILAYDHPGMDDVREQVREAHRACLAEQGSRLLGSGALLGEDGKTIVGGASLLDTEDRAEAIRFEADDPYARAGMRRDVDIVRWRLRWWMGVFSPQGHTPSGKSG